MLACNIVARRASMPMNIHSHTTLLQIFSRICVRLQQQREHIQYLLFRLLYFYYIFFFISSSPVSLFDLTHICTAPYDDAVAVYIFHFCFGFIFHFNGTERVQIKKLVFSQCKFHNFFYFHSFAPRECSWEICISFNIH